ncbi:MULTISPECIES: alpha/beta fold hydrolase [Pseudonocardia]|uniref:2-hydroxy-6-oxononadienedioate/2-hydroxy-6-oxononatrienedioate hydrolase n=2 Tax=Pseudonocardia TaxID=1847 RepID=A0A1Y2N834_PSEAH|nr:MULTISPECIES: alpha/beta fold hydrolase [Pseudonocardia]OSY43247.1 2-hydroxy-6-oxononadienedioate/2-hydroxy-6-oxononatrienedioate hydrolase [Pseudonocardia autotrophica]TDN71735.1 pimeloyl-ACP methyl ester carboxylesterase [Pseudonocardia autotrophica]BBG02422.1 acetoin dehydrogenase [Pseudonocardia autotrophica]GEC23242.1 acetoin dehydrogenase [Pseudonocardia saturnea]
MTRYVDAGGVRIRIRESGDPAGEPVLLLHGIGRSLEDWDQQHELLSGYRVIAADLAGFGYSDRVHGPATLAKLADTALATLDALGETRPAHVMGNSLGGAVALLLSTRAPDRVATLVLADPAGFGTEVTPALRVLGVPLLGRFLLGRMDARAARQTERSLFVDRSLVTEERVTRALEIAARPEFAQTFLEMITELGTVRGVRAGWRSALLSAAAKAPKPTLVVWGERDLILPVSQLRAAARELPQVTTHVFGRVGHMPQIEVPERFATLALAHIGQTARRTSISSDTRAGSA